MKKINIIILTLIIAGCSQSENSSMTLIEDQLSKIIPIELNIESITDSQLPNFFEVKLSDGSFFYVEKGGEYLVLGDIFKITNEPISIFPFKYSKAMPFSIIIFAYINIASRKKSSPVTMTDSIFKFPNIFLPITINIFSKAIIAISRYTFLSVSYTHLTLPTSDLV